MWYLIVSILDLCTLTYFELALAVCWAHGGLPVGLSFAPVVRFYLLLSPYLCFISFLYLDLYVLGDNALIS